MTEKGWKFHGNERKYLDEVLNNGFGASESGSMNERLEHKFASIHNKKFAITANTGTSTLHMGLHSFGIQPGDEIIVPSLTVAMPGFAIWQSGGIPVYCDVFPDTFLMDTNDIEQKITEKTKAILAVHMYGNMCNMEKIMSIARKNNLYVLEDCAQCFLAHDDKNRISGTVGHVGSWSFENSKHVTSGDGGIVLSDDEELATDMRQFGGVGFKNINASQGKIRISRDKFQDPNWERHSMLAYNYRLPELCAAVALAQCEHIDKFVNLRIQMAQEYLNVFKTSSLFQPQKVMPGYKNTYWTFTAHFLGKEYGIEWQEFRKKYIEFGGDGIYAATKLIQDEPAFKQINLGYGETPIASKLQQELMLFTTNQKDENERNLQVSALEKTIQFFK
jgi:perosamine synthetase